MVISGYIYIYKYISGIVQLARHKQQKKVQWVGVWVGVGGYLGSIYAERKRHGEMNQFHKQLDIDIQTMRNGWTMIVYDRT